MWFARAWNKSAR